MNRLNEYNKKRNFNNTPEPEGKLMCSEGKNRFVIQHHIARRKHYDFRLQSGDALISWAIPKKPVYDSNVKRLAVKVEDHPLEYIHFEGKIPKGNYGAGTVMVWDKLSLPAYCKTSGSRGLHIYVPVHQKYSYQQVQNFVKLLEKHIHKQFSSLTSFERSPSKRQGKIYLDYLQNAKGKTMSSAYSLRPRPGALVSAPVGWDEMENGIRPEQFNLRNMRERLEKNRRSVGWLF